jgi:hypothetical protein
MKTTRALFILALFVGMCLVAIHPARAVASAEIQNSSAWIDTLGILHIFGEVNNTGDAWLQYIKITGTLRDGSGGIVDVIFTFTTVRYLPPGGVAPFDMTEIDTAKSARVQSYTLVGEFQETAAIAQQLSVVNVADSKNVLGWLEVVGEVENHASAPSVYTKVAATFYDADGNVTYVTFTFTQPNEIPPGGRYAFKVTVGSDERTTQVARYSLTAESEISGYTSVPEFPYPVLLIATALTLAMVTLRRR